LFTPDNWQHTPLSTPHNWPYTFPYSWVQVRERNTFYFHEIPMPEPRTVRELERAVAKALLPGNANGRERRIFRYI
jgi:hypothetical protein